MADRGYCPASRRLFSLRQLPQPSHAGSPCRPLPQPYAPRTASQHIVFLDCHGPQPGPCWAGASSAAKRMQRTFFTERGAWQADGCTEIHQGLIEITRVTGRNPPL